MQSAGEIPQRTRHIAFTRDSFITVYHRLESCSEIRKRSWLTFDKYVDTINKCVHVYIYAWVIYLRTTSFAFSSTLKRIRKNSTQYDTAWTQYTQVGVVVNWWLEFRNYFPVKNRKLICQLPPSCTFSRFCSCQVSGFKGFFKSLEKIWFHNVYTLFHRLSWMD